MDMSAGSASELDYQLLLAKDLGFLEPDSYQALSEKIDHIRRMLTNLIKSTRARTDPEHRKVSAANARTPNTEK